jgi:phosphoribosylformylglycinamidine cyclo-ligase
MSKKQKAYAAAGVDVDLGNRVKSGLPALLAATRRRECLGTVGGFGGLFALDLKRHREPVLVSSVDGVGTKLKIAFAMNRHDTIGQDLVNHCVNDIAVIGAEPLFFLDYLGAGKLEPKVFTAIIKGFAKACAENGCALIGGETAQMPGFYQPGEYDVSGTIVGVVERGEMLDGTRDAQVGDVLLGIASNGLHTNGYSLARKILFEDMKLEPGSRVPELGRTTVGEELLRVHVSYGPLILRLLKTFNRRPSRGAGGGRRRSKPPIRAFAHITGGGFVDNLPRVLPAKCDALVRKGSWEMPPIFRLLAANGGVDEQELYQVFNMGIGMVAVVDRASEEAVLRAIRRQKMQAWVIGELVKGSGKARVV